MPRDVRTERPGRWPQAIPILVGVALLLAGCAQPADEAPEAGSEDASPRLLFVQDAGLGAATRAADGSLLLVLSAVDPKTLWFTDRPDREAGLMTTSAFVRMWDEGEHSFADDPPNAALVIHLGGAEMDVFVVELTDPSYEEDRGTLKYVAKPLGSEEAFLEQHMAEAQHGSEMPAEFGEIDLFIDSAAPTDAIDAAMEDGIVPALKAGAPPTSGPLKFGQSISIGVSASAGPYLHATPGPWPGPTATVSLASSGGSAESWTISCPLFAMDDRTFSCTSGIDRNLQYLDFVAFSHGAMGRGYDGQKEYLGVYEQTVWADIYGSGGRDVLRTWRLYDPRNLANSAAIQPGDPVVLVDIWKYHDFVLQHPSGGLATTAILGDNWLFPTDVPTNPEAQWFFQRS